MTDASPYRNAAQDPEVMARMMRDAQAASNEFIDRYNASFGPMRTDQDQIARAIAAYEETRMTARPKPKFILEIKDGHFYAKPSRATFADVVIVALTGAAWFGFLFSLWVIFA